MTVRRIKSYTAETGLVYQYYFVGKRPALPEAPEGPATEFVFDATLDGKLMVAVSIFLPREAVAAWELDHQRPLGESEQYAAAKLRLLRAFDEDEKLLAAGASRHLLDAEALEELLASLGVE